MYLRLQLKKTPLHFGSERGHAGVVESLAAYGATIDSQNSVSNCYTALVAIDFFQMYIM